MSPYREAGSKERVVWSPNVPTFTREVIPELNIKSHSVSKYSPGVGLRGTSLFTYNSEGSMQL